MTVARLGLGRSPWLLAAVVLAGVEFVLITGSSGESHQSNRHPPDALGYGLVALVGLTVVAARGWPLASFGTALAAVLAYAGLGYATDGPIFLAVPVTLYFAMQAGHLRRSVGLGALASLALVVVYGVLSPNDVPSAAFFVPVVMVAVATVGYLASHRSMQIEQLRQAEARRLVTEERLRIARELHDVVSHSISVINVQAGVAAHVIDSQPEQAKDALLTIKATGREALRELRGMLGVLRGVDEDEPKNPAPGLGQLDALLEATAGAGLSASLTTSGRPRRLSPTVDLTAYRIVQEALTNALRHAGPASARVHLAYDDDQLMLEVSDDGRGTASPSPGSGLGIVGMRERVLAVGGHLETGPVPGGGFRVLARLPIAGGE